ncbi:hypothetical protein [Halomonas cerina]|uniref:Uncharacterized protein n=1 Tax=Halomonas cerina TaxID=447424 RepID=A0A839VIJ9_9GAMM|nr:hypothetical protein [Halomonas cerina]MBB3192404.1 hypothetical protein [Halomonas cerina]
MLKLSARLLQIALFLLVSTTAYAEPTRKAIIDYLEGRLPSHLDVTDLKFKAFPYGSGVGRVSIEGQVKLTEQLLVPVSEDPVPELFAKTNTIEEFEFARHQLPKHKIYKVKSIRVTERYPFSAELQYEERVSSTAFGGTVNYPRLGRNQKTRAKLRSNEVVIDSERYYAYINMIREKLNVLNEYRENAFTELESIRSANKAHVIQEGTGNRFTINLDEANEISWKSGELLRIHFVVNGTIRWPKDGRLYNTRYKAGETHRASLEVEYRPVNVEHRPFRHSSQGNVVITLSIFDTKKNKWYRTILGSEYKSIGPNKFEAGPGQGRNRFMSFEGYAKAEEDEVGDTGPSSDAQDDKNVATEGPSAPPFADIVAGDRDSDRGVISSGHEQLEESPSPTVEQLRDEGLQMIVEGDYATALELLEHSLEIEQDEAIAGRVERLRVFLKVRTGEDRANGERSE